MPVNLIYEPFNSLSEQQTAEQALKDKINTDYAAEDIAADSWQSGGTEDILK
jgi:hypothetical protein